MCIRRHMWIARVLSTIRVGATSAAVIGDNGRHRAGDASHLNLIQIAINHAGLKVDPHYALVDMATITIMYVKRTKSASCVRYNDYVYCCFQRVCVVIYQHWESLRSQLTWCSVTCRNTHSLSYSMYAVVIVTAGVLVHPFHSLPAGCLSVWLW